MQVAKPLEWSLSPARQNDANKGAAVLDMLQCLRLYVLQDLSKC